MIEKLKLALEKYNFLIITTASPDFQEIIYVNDNILNLTGYSRSELIGKSPKIFQGPETSEQTKKEIKENLSLGKEFTTNILNYTKTGEQYWLELSIFPIEENGEKFFVSIQRNITHSKNEQHKFKLQKNIIQQSLNSKIKLLSYASHDLRTPLNSIIGYSDMISMFSSEESMFSSEEKVKEYADNIKEASNILLSLINDLLETSGDIPVPKKKNEDISNILRTCIDHISCAYSICTFDLSLKSLVIEHDQKLMSRAFNNILSNSAKYSEDGHIKISMIKNEDNIIISVVNKGKINEINLDQKNQFNNAHNGYGIMITNAIINSHGGKLNIYNKDGHVYTEIHLPI